MTDNDKIKALECCSEAMCYIDCVRLGCQARLDDGCYYSTIVSDEYNDAEIMHVQLKDVVAIINRQKAEIDTLTKEKDYLNCIIHDFVEQVPYFETKAIKKFAEKVNEMALHILDDEYIIWKCKFDDILKEIGVSME